MTSRTENYVLEGKDKNTTRQEKIRRLKRDLRGTSELLTAICSVKLCPQPRVYFTSHGVPLVENIRYLADYPIMSPEWLRMTEALNQVSDYNNEPTMGHVNLHGVTFHRLAQWRSCRPE